MASLLFWFMSMTVSLPACTFATAMRTIGKLLPVSLSQVAVKVYWNAAGANGGVSNMRSGPA